MGNQAAMDHRKLWKRCPLLKTVKQDGFIGTQLMDRIMCAVGKT